MIDIDIRGDKTLERNLKQLNWRVAGSLMSNATRSGAALLRKYARTYVPKRTGNLRRAMTYKRTIRARGLVQYSVGFGDRSYYGDNLEMGGYYNVRDSSSKGPRRKMSRGNQRYQPAHPMLRRAYSTHGNAVMQKTIDMLWAGIQREAAKL